MAEVNLLDIQQSLSNLNRTDVRIVCCELEFVVASSEIPVDENLCCDVINAIDNIIESSKKTRDEMRLSASRTLETDPSFSMEDSPSSTAISNSFLESSNLRFRKKSIMLLN